MHTVQYLLSICVCFVVYWIIANVVISIQEIACVTAIFIALNVDNASIIAYDDK